MLDNGTKRRIDNARQVLVGKVPDPKAQVEQITTALIYKFMDDMDQESVELGGKASFFIGEYEKYAWPKVMAKSLGGYDRLAIYSEAITRMSQNPNLPQLFRDIFNDAFLPYRDPETLNLFLKEIDGFTYDHSERLGDAFEYLLSVLGSQGAAGQFRTPRHIINFIVEAVNPTKTDTVLDPACGTAGFLISAYKHILAKNQEKKLSPDEMQRLTKNFVGYDISPDMVRLSLVNMYLHQFQKPTVFEYDTLTSEERWDDSFDVILANPPFMSPKGGIRPHSRFSVQAKRSEVLFVDYIAEHLNPSGRAGVIVPEGIIFQSARAYKALRKMLIEENYLYAVVSLPAGVFNPYSGVKTSILLMDRTLAKNTDSILFVNIENDGFDLGAQRNAIEVDDLPEALDIIQAFQKDSSKEPSNPVMAQFALKSKIGEDGNFNFSGIRYKKTVSYETNVWKMVELKELCEIQSGSRQKGGALDEGIPSIGGGQISPNGSIIFEKMKYISEDHFSQMSKGKLQKGDVLIVKDGATTRKTGFYNGNYKKAAVNEHVFILRANNKIHPFFLYKLIQSKTFINKLRRYIKGIIGGISLEIKEITIPLPPLEAQQAIVDEIEGYQKIIDGARQVVENYRPRIKVDPDWPMVELGKVITLEYGKGLKKDDRIGGDYPVFGSNGVVGYHNEYLVEGPFIIVGRKGSAGAVTYSEKSGFPIDTTFYVNINDTKRLELKFIYYQLLNLELDKVNVQAGVPGLNRNDAYRIKVHIPSFDVQKNIVTQIEAEQKFIDANTKLIEIFEKKIENKIAEVWGEEVG